MANYNCTIRTNYFRVKDEDKFRELMSRVCGCEDSVELWEETKDSNTVFGFGVYGGISGVTNAKEDSEEDCDESSYDEFIDGLQECVANDDAIIIFEVGNEKMRYVVGSATIITSSAIRYLDIERLAIEEATKLLNNPDWDTKCVY